MTALLVFSAFVALALSGRALVRIIQRILPEDARRLVHAGAQLVDVRGRHDFMAAHLPRACNIPFDELGDRLKQLGSRARVLIVYADSGSESADAVAVLRKAGFTRVHDLGPMARWTERR